MSAGEVATDWILSVSFEILIVFCVPLKLAFKKRRPLKIPQRFAASILTSLKVANFSHC